MRPHRPYRVLNAWDDDYLNAYARAIPTAAALHAEEEEEAESSPSCMTWASGLYLVLFLLVFFFTGLVVYALIAFNTDAARHSCEGLWTFVLLRTIIGCVTAASLFTFNILVGYSELSFAHRQIGLAFGLLYFMALAIYGAVMVGKNMVSNASCVNAIQDSTFRVPLLGDLGWVYVACDALYAVGALILLYFSYAETQEEDVAQ
jgi:hypothetical protein